MKIRNDNETSTPRGKIDFTGGDGWIFIVDSWQTISKKSPSDFLRRAYYAFNAGDFGIFDFKTKGKTKDTPVEELMNISIVVQYYL